MPLPGYSPDLMPVEALWRWLREDVTSHHCHASAEDLTRRVADFEAHLTREPFVIADRLWVKDTLDPRAVQRSLHGPQREHCIDASDSDAIAPVTHVVHVVEAEDVGGEGSQASEDAGVAADPTVVLAEADIADIEQPVLDPPMAAH